MFPRDIFLQVGVRIHIRFQSKGYLDKIGKYRARSLVINQWPLDDASTKITRGYPGRISLGISGNRREFVSTPMINLLVPKGPKALKFNHFC